MALCVSVELYGPQQKIDLVIVNELFHEIGRSIRVAPVVMHDQFDLVAVVAHLDAAVFAVDPFFPKDVALSGELAFLGIPARFADGGPDPDDLLFIVRGAGDQSE